MHPCASLLSAASGRKPQKHAHSSVSPAPGHKRFSASLPPSRPAVLCRRVQLLSEPPRARAIYLSAFSWQELTDTQGE